MTHDTPNELFPLSLKLLQMNYAVQILGYLRRRSDTGLGEAGTVVQGHMQRLRQCSEENVTLYYDILRPVMNQLLRYPTIEENARVSGHYEGQRLQHLVSLKAILQEMEAQTDLMHYLSSMLTSSGEHLPT